MSYLLYTGQTVEAPIAAKHPRAAEFERRLFDLNNEAATELAAHLGVNVNLPVPQIFDANFDAAFSPAFEGQAMPDALAGFDTDSEWGEN
jgi:hypothetical protein